MCHVPEKACFYPAVVDNKGIAPWGRTATGTTLTAHAKVHSTPERTGMKVYASARDRRAAASSPWGGGFTLVELLVVVAIIALLLAILLPTVEHVRKLAIDTICAAKLKAVNTGFNLYANSYEDQMPLGYHRIWNCGKQYNYVLCRPKDGDDDIRWMNWGYVYQAEVIFEPRDMYCPANEIPMLSFNYHGPGLDNPWPPEAGSATRVGYGTRPMVKWDWWNGPAGPLPERRQLSSGTAIIGDIVSSPTNLDYGHVTGVNMNYADGSVVWLDREQLEPTLSQLPSGFDWSLDDLVLNEDDPQSLWMLLNR